LSGLKGSVLIEKYKTRPGIKHLQAGEQGICPRYAQKQARMQAQTYGMEFA
jgi:hypothetical protein